MMNEIKERLEAAFQQAKILEEIKKEALSTFDEISEQLSVITGGNVRFVTRQYRTADFDTSNFIHIRHVLDSTGTYDLRLLGYEVDPIKGFPVVIETKETRDSYMSKKVLADAVLDIVTSEVIMNKILKIMSKIDDENKDIPF